MNPDQHACAEPDDEANGPSPVELDVLRSSVRDFISTYMREAGLVSRCDSWLSGWNPAFSRALGARGWVGMTFPIQYGGHGASAAERFVVLEELLAAGAPVAAHWFADRQSGPAILKFGTAEQKHRLLPQIATGELYFCIGMSESEAGSDLASVRTRAAKVDGGWSISGTKVWTSGAHHANIMLTLARTSPGTQDRRRALSQFLIDLTWPGVSVRPIYLISGEHHFNEVILDEVFVPDGALLGTVGEGWSQVTSELTFERSGPERILSTIPLLRAAAAAVASDRTSREVNRVVGRLVARLAVLRQMSFETAILLGSTDVSMTRAAVIKDLGTEFELDVIDGVRQVLEAADPDRRSSDIHRLLAEAVTHSPGFQLRGGTTEIIRSIVAKASINA